MSNLTGALAAFAASATWAYASARYARVSHDLGSVRVNTARALTAFPAFLVGHWLLLGPNVLAGVTRASALWLLLSIVSSYAAADSLFFTAARRAGVTTALSIASVYPLWAALWGALVAGESFGPVRASGTVLAVLGIVWLVRLGDREDPVERPGARSSGLLLAALTSVLWAANSVAIKNGARDLEPLQVNAVRYGMAVVLLVPQTWWNRSPGEARFTVRSWWSLAPALLADTVVGSLCYVYGLSHTDLAVGATLSSLAPLLSVPVALAFGDERWDSRRFSAICATVTGVAVLVSGGG